MSHRGVPSLVEIGRRFGIKSPNGVRSHILSLERKGLIGRDRDKARSIRLTAAPGRVAAAITSIKKKIWSRRRIFVHVPLYLSFRTRKGYPFFEGALKAEIDRAVRKVSADHGWDLLHLEILPDRLTVGIHASPDHSVERVARNFKNAALLLNLKHPLVFHGRGVWASGFAAASDPLVLAGLSDHHRLSLEEGQEEETS